MAAVWFPYLAIAAVTAAGLVRLLLSSWLGGDLPYLRFFGAVMAAAWYGGLRPGLFATALSVATTTAFFIVPDVEGVGLRPVHVVGILMFSITGWLISAAAEQLRHTHVVFLDPGMPGMDGLEAARRIRALPGTEQTLLIAVTGWGQERDRVQTSEAGFDAHLVKPADPFELRSLIARAPVPESVAPD